MQCKHGVLGPCILCMGATKRRKEFETMKQEVALLKAQVGLLKELVEKIELKTKKDH